MTIIKADNNKIIIAIDGPSGSGKGELASRLAAHFKIKHIDSGLFFRKIAYLSGKSTDDLVVIAKSIDKLENSNLYRTEELANKASKLAQSLEIREIFKSTIIKLSENNAVIDGRDIGSVIFKDAQVKIFLTADEGTRIQRRQNELKNEFVKNSIKTRDQRDTARQISPLLKSDDAYHIDTTNMTIKEVFEKAKNFAEKTLFNK